MNQLQRIITALTGGRSAHIGELHEETGILRPNIRRILGVGTKEGRFERLAEGVYALATTCGQVKAYVQCGASEDSLHALATEGVKFDSLLLDPAYFSPALVGGNRGIKHYDFIHVPEFARLMQAAAQLLRTPTSHVYLMLSGAPSAQADMAGYVAAALGAGLQLVQEGTYRKTYQNGQPVMNVRGQVAAPERLLLLTPSGQVRAGELADVQVNFEVPRPSVASGYPTEKASVFIDRLIRQSTHAGEWLLDPFGGSGVTGERCLRLQRFAVLIERLRVTIHDYILPRLAKATLPAPEPQGRQLRLFESNWAPAA